MKTRQKALMRQLQLFDSYEVYMVLPEDGGQDGTGKYKDSRVEVLRITGQEEATTTVMIN